MFVPMAMVSNTHAIWLIQKWPSTVGTLFSSQRERPSRLSAASTKQRPRHLTHRPCASECKTSERACRRQSTGAPNIWQNCCGATSKDGLTESRPPESLDSETRRPAGKSAASVSPAPPRLLRARRQRPRHRTPEQRDELAAF